MYFNGKTRFYYLKADRYLKSYNGHEIFFEKVKTKAKKFKFFLHFFIKKKSLCW